MEHKMSASTYAIECEEMKKEYFIKATGLLAKYNWIYNFPVTRFLQDKVWRHIPHEWMPCLMEASYDELNSLPNGEVKDNCPKSLQDFIKQSREVSLHRSAPKEVTPVAVQASLKRGMCPKKLHEVSHMVGVVHKLCQTQGCSNILDVGSGLGYLSMVLSEQYGYKLLGVESEGSRSHGATARAAKATGRQSKFDSVEFELQDTEESHKALNALLSDISASHCPSDSMPTDGPNYSEIKHGGNLKLQAQCDRQLSSDTNTEDGPIQGFTRKLQISEQQRLQNIDVLPDDRSFSAHCDIKQLESGQRGNSSIPTACEQSQKQVQGISISSPEKDVPIDKMSKDESGHYSNHGNWCMVGLHCCGDLTPTMLKSFLHTPHITCLVTLSCCYHRMSDSAGDGHSHRYRQFPLSKQLKETLRALRKEYPDWNLNTYAMRLAAQETRMRWCGQSKEDHIFHTKNVAFRGLIEMAALKENVKMEKMHRKLARQSHFADFDSYLEAVLDRTILADSSARERLSKSCRSLHTEYESYFSLVEPFTVVLQPVLESLILRDRLAFLREHDNIEAHILPIFDENISPRNLAIVAWKS